jgi:hypothetical protein
MNVAGEMPSKFKMFPLDHLSLWNCKNPSKRMGEMPNQKTEVDSRFTMIKMRNQNPNFSLLRISLD